MLRTGSPIYVSVLAVCLALASTFTSGVALASTYVPDQVICKLAEGYTIEEVNDWYGTVTLEWIPGTELYLLGTTDIEDIEAYADLMEQNENIASADPNYYAASPEAVRQMPLAVVGGTEAEYEDQDVVERIGLDLAHQRSLGAGTTVAVLDTGVDPTHPSLSGRLLVGYDFVTHDQDTSEEASGVDEDGDGIVDGGFGHGTMVAGIVALVAPQASILPVRMLGDEGIGTAWDAIEGIRFATDFGVDVMNMSFGTPAEVPLLAEEIDRAQVAGVVIVAAAGNQSSGVAPYHPAAHEKALMITAVDSVDVKADFADWHQSVTVSAPGTGIRSTYPGGTWALGSGCSFATPFVSGEIALLIPAIAPASPQFAVKRVTDGVDEIYDLPPNLPFLNQLGTGRIDVGQALTVVSTGEPATPIGAHLDVRPNPSAGFVHVTLDTEQLRADARVDVFSSDGRLVRSFALGSTRVTWDGCTQAGAPAATGVYFLRVTNGPERHQGSVRLLR